MRLRVLPALAMTAALVAAPVWGAAAAPIVTSPLAVLPAGSVPSSIVVDAAGNVYTSNIGLNSISKVTPAGAITPAFATLPAGTGLREFVMTTTGIIYTVNFTANTMSQVLADGTTDAAYFSFGAGTNPTGIAIAPDDTIYFANSGPDTITRLSPNGTVLSVNFAALAPGADPVDITVDEAGNVYTLNSNLTISKITPAGVVTAAFAALPPATSIGNIVVNSAGFVYVADLAGNRIEQFDSTGSYNGSAALTAQPGRIALDDDDNIFATLPSEKTIAMVSAIGGALTPSIASITPAADYIALAVTPDDTVYAAGYTNPVLSRVQLSAAITSVAPTSSGTVDAAYSFAVTASGYDPLAFRTVGTTPPGITIAPATGMLSGTPSTAGTYTFEVVASNMFGDSTRQSVTITVAPAPVPTPTPTPTTPTTTATAAPNTSASAGGSGGNRPASSELARTGGAGPEPLWFSVAAASLLAGIGGMSIRRLRARSARG